jgi:hypothetical protein
MTSSAQDGFSDLFPDYEGKLLGADEVIQMMFVSGETVEPSPETTMLVEQLVQQQVMEMVSSLICPLMQTKLMTCQVARLHCARYTSRQP